MLFHTWIFLLFFLIFYPVYLLCKNTRFKELWLLFASYTFYGWWNPLFLLLIVWSTTVDFAMVSFMDRFGRIKLWLSLSILNNLILLGFFKYSGFVAANINHLLTACSIPYTLAEPNVLLPVGISFYVFQSMGYAIDFYRGRIEREKSWVRYAAFVSLFPQLVAGPIERAGHLLPQLRKRLKISSQDISEGLSLFIVGLFKKVALADYFALYVDKVYDMPDQYQAPALILATVAFGWQIYFDFSGYTDMARGVARMMGIRLMLNFNNPYMATGLGDFWRRWHISLTSWMRDFLFLPMSYAFSKRIKSDRFMWMRTDTFVYAAGLSLTWLLVGLWHGAGWTFVIWGGLHALGRIATRKLENRKSYKHNIPQFVKQLWVFAFVSFTWIFFRAESFNDAILILSRIFTAGWNNPQFPLFMLFLIIFAWTYQYVYESRLRVVLQSAPIRIGLAVGMMLYLVLFASASNQPFIYFQF